MTDAERLELLRDKATSLARLVEQLAYEAVGEFYAKHGNPAPLKLLRLAVDDIDKAAAR